MFSVILAEPSNDTPDIVLAVASVVAVLALPVNAPETFAVNISPTAGVPVAPTVVKFVVPTFIIMYSVPLAVVVVFAY